MTTKNVLVLYTPRRSTQYLERISAAQVAFIRDALLAEGLKTAVHSYHPAKLAGILDKTKPDLIFNLAYGYFDRQSGQQESQADVVEKLETAGIPVVGSSSKVQRLVQDKLACGEMLRKHRIHAPLDVNRDCAARFPLAIRKPRFGACHREVMLLDPRQFDWSQFDPESQVLQEYIDGEEFTVAVIEDSCGVRVLPPLHIRFAEVRGPRVLGPKSKYTICPANLHQSQLTDVARRVFKCLGMQDYTRMDFRMRNGAVYVLDVNALPNLDPERSYLPFAARSAGISYPRLIQLLVSKKLSYSSSGGK